MILNVKTSFIFQLIFLKEITSLNMHKYIKMILALKTSKLMCSYISTPTYIYFKS